MTDDEQIRALLRLAAELPDHIEPPVGRLIHRGRRRRELRMALSAVSAAAVVSAAVAVVPVLRTLGTGQARVAPSPAPSGVFGYQRLLPGGPTGPEIFKFHWSALPASPAGSRSQPVLAWTGTELIELGGLKNGGTAYGGAAYSPATGRWRWIAQPRGNVGYSNAVSVWTGRQLFVTNGQLESCLSFPGRGTAPTCLPQAGLYDPVANKWTLTQLPKELWGLNSMAAVWTGRDVIVAGAATNGGELAVAGYDPATGRWQAITPRLPARHPARFVSLVAAPGRLILWSFWDRVSKTKDGFSDYAGVDVLALDPAGGWRDVTGNWPQNKLVTAPLLTSLGILVSPGQTWCGRACSPPYIGEDQGYFADPLTLRRTVIPAGPLGQADPAFVWCGQAVIAVNLDFSGGQPALGQGELALWDPATGKWRPLAAPPGYPALAATPVWAGDQLLALTNDGRLLSLHG